MKRSAHMRTTKTTKTTIPCRMRMAAIAAALAMAMAACEDMTTTTTPNTETPSSGSPAASKQPTCPDRAIRLLDRSGSDIHGAIVDDTLHMGGESARATCTETADLSLLAGSPIPGGREAQSQQSQYYLIMIRYPDGNNRLYVIRRASGTDCIVDTNDMCVATVSGLPDDFDLEEDLPEDVPPTIPGGQDAPPEQPDTDTKPDAVENPYPRNGKTGVTVAPLLSWAASPQAASYDLYYGTTKDLTGTPITTENTAVTIPRPGATDQRLAGDTTYYWRVDAKNDAGATRGTVWSFTTEASDAAVPNVAGIYEGNTTYVRTRTAEGDVVREEAVTRDRLQVWSVQLTGYGGKPITVMSKFTILEVLPGDDSEFRDYLNGGIGDGPIYGCFLSPDGTCVFERPGAVYSHTFKGNQMSVRIVEAPLKISGTYEKVGDDPGPPPQLEPTLTPPTQPAPPVSRPATCNDLAIRLLDRGAGIHGAIIADTLHMGGETAPATCLEPASLATGWSLPDGRTEQAQQSQSGYYLIVINYPGGNRLYVVSRRSGGTRCVVDTNDQCIAQVTDLPDDFDLKDLPEDVRPTIPGGRPAPPTVRPTPGGGDTPPAPPATTVPGSASNPHPRNGATGVTVAPLLSWASSPRALSYDLYYGTTRNLAHDAALGTPINTANTAVPIPGGRRLAGDTTYYWRVDAKNEAGATRGPVWSFTTGAD